MAEALALASAIASLVTLVGQVTKLSYVFLSDIKNASKSQKLYLQEVSAFTEILLRMEQALEVQEVAFSQISISKISLQDCHTLLQSLKTSLERASERSVRIEKLKSSLRWPFDEREIKEHVERLRRFRDMFVAALSSDAFIVSVATYQKVNELSQDNAYQRILKQLGSSPHPLSSAALLDSTCPGTGRWFLAQKQYLEWRSGSSTFLWCYGKPGVGKTVITSIVLQNLHDLKVSPTRSVLYHFCDFAERKVEKTATIIQSFLRQIIQNSGSEAISLLQARLEALNSSSLESLSRLLLDVALTKTNIYLIIDALDELDDRQALISTLRKLADGGVKVFVTSRDIPDIRDAFQMKTTLEIQASRSDLEEFVSTRLRESDYYDSLSPNAEIISTIVDQTGGIFLLAQLLMKRLLSLTTIKQMRQALTSMPSNLTEAYESDSKRILAQPPSRAKLATRVLGWITHAERRLKVDELRHALAVEEGASEIDAENLTSVKIILKVSIGLVSVDPTDGTIGMIHATAYDYFRDLQQRERPSDIQTDIAKTSMSYLAFHPICNGICTSVEQLRDRLQDMPFLGYAAEHWGSHASKVERELGTLIFQILNDSETRGSSFQALQYRELRDPRLAAVTFDSLPIGLEPLHVAAYWNLTITAESLLKDGIDPNTRDTQGWTALHWACSQGCLEMMELLLKYQADMDARDHSGWTPLFWAVIKGHSRIITRLLQENAKHLLTDVNNWTVLHWAASKGDTTIVTTLLEHHSKFKAWQKPVKILIKDVSVERAKLLCKPTAHGKTSKAPLELAAEQQDVHTFDTILEGLAAEGPAQNFNELWAQRGFEEPRVSIPWRILSKSDHFDERGLGRWNINDKCESSTAWKSKLLHGAIRDGKAIVVRLLVELGADLQGISHERAPLHQAAFLKDPEIAEILLSNGADATVTTSEGQTPLHLAVACGHDRTAKVFLRHGVDINTKDHEGRTPLMLASEIPPKRNDLKMGSIPLSMVEMLIDQGANVDAMNRGGRNALHVAANTQRPDFGLLKLLLGSGVDADLADSQGYKPLHYFCQGFYPLKGKVESDVEQAFDILLALSAPNAESTELRPKDYSGDECGFVETPLSIAIEAENWPAFHLLLAKGATMRCTKSPNDLLWKAAYHWALQPKAVKMVLALGASTTVKQYGYRPMGHGAIEGLFNDGASTESPFEDFKAILNMYIDAGLDLNDTDKENKTLLHIAVSKAKESYESALTQYLIDLGVDIYRPVCGVWDAFLLAAVYGRLSALRVLVSHAAKNPNTQHWLELPSHPSDQSSFDDSLLSLICSSLSHANLLDTKDSLSLNPLEVAVSLSNAPMVSALLSAGADLLITDRSGWTVLHTATLNKSLPLVQLLLSNASCSTLTNAPTIQWSHSAGAFGARPSGLHANDPWTGTPLHLAAMIGEPEIVATLLQHGADVKARTGSEAERTKAFWPGHGPTALHIALDTGTFYGTRENLGKGMLSGAQLLVEAGADVTGVADHITLHQVLKFEGFEGLWKKLRAGITEKGKSVERSA